MKADTAPALPPRTVADLVEATGLNKDTVKNAIRTGELPGYKVGARYVIPGDAFEAFCNGTWIPAYRPIFTEPIKPQPATEPVQMLRKRAS